MKIILTTLNSKFIHSNLAIRYLKEYAKDINPIEIYEYTINQHIDYIVSELYKKDPDIIGFSTYIWNLNETLEICKILKIVKPNLKILIGGPEVSFDSKDIMENHKYIDFILRGEGERTFRELLIQLKGNKEYYKVDGLTYREDDKIKINRERELIRDLNEIPSPYTNIGKEFKNKIVYYESSRGCPFNCQFCLSSTIKGVRYFDIDRVKNDLKNLIEGEVRQVKFVDRTFNANKEYAYEIMNFIIKEDPENINFHFEVTGHLVDDEMLEFLKNVKDGLFQFEIGVQSTNDKTIKAIGRVTDFDRLSYVTRKIDSYDNIHQHLDLIAGLPYEDYETFGKSFDDVYKLGPEKLQLGFLKLLKGSGLRQNEEKYGYKYLDKPPYEVLENNFIDYGEIIKLKAIEDIVEKYSNENYFKMTIKYILNNHYYRPFNFFEDFSEYWEFKKLNKVSHSRNKLYIILEDFCKYKGFNDIKVISNLIKYDFIFNHNKMRIPHKINLGTEKDNRFNIHDVLKDDRTLENYLSEYKNKPTKYILNKVTVEYFDINVINIISRDFKVSEKDIEGSFVLFKHKESDIKRCKSYDITHIVEELI